MRANPNDTNGPDFSQGFVRSGDLVTVTIGRNVNHGDLQPMDDARWADFVEAVSYAVQRVTVASDTFGPFYGTGSWVDEATGATVTEDSAVLTFIVGYSIAVDAFDRTLGVLASQYDQDAIAWSTGTARLARTTRKD